MDLNFTGDSNLSTNFSEKMGLCKCPKRKVTNQFCFEHRVNVCEHCMVANHATCIVKSYLQWLQDSDYNPNCLFCDGQLDLYFIFLTLIFWLRSRVGQEARLGCGSKWQVVV